MAEGNVEIVRRTFEIALRAGVDPGAAFDQCVSEGLLASNVEWRGGARAGQAAAGVENAVGRDEYLEMTSRFTENFEDFVYEVEEIIDAGNDRVVALTRASGLGRRSGALVEMRMAQVYWLETGRIVRVVPFLDRDDALESVGLRE
jgi:ketosteroid isomerase-like protein